jgi:serine/threonine protein kinase/tetratricopeptide (TPR) repeat protein
MRSPDAERWRALSAYLDEALDLEPDGRAVWLSALEARDPDVAGDLAVWLARYDHIRDEPFLQGVAIESRFATPPSLAGQVLGAYRLLEPIGEGGSGSVWLAERCDGHFEGRAAVKLLNLALVGRSGQERFRREGSILARLQHPRIAHLVDAGISPTGQPYLVLEYVDGQPIDQYAAACSLDVEARLRLFLDVLDGVAHAHAALIVHRDIKPANVLVSVDGSVKLLDFGIAKLVDADADVDAVRSPEAAALTRELSRALTPEYAAPEQLVGAPVTTATDIYALGVLLYVLLAGRHPAARALRTPNTLIRAIVDEEPARVSEAIGDAEADADIPHTHAAHCGTTPSRLRRQLRGDLDTIVAKALKKDARERYASVTALADDVRRYLRHEPISARPDSLGYRTARFLRRHVIGVGVALGTVLLVGTMTALYTHRLAVERDRAQRESAKAVKVSGMLMGVLSSADPYSSWAAGSPPSPQRLLDAGVDQVQRELTGEPELQAELLTMMGRTYRRMGSHARAEGLLRQALAGARTAYGAEHLRVAQALQDLGVVRAERGQYADAQRYLEDALAMRRRLVPAGDAELGVLLAELGRVYQDLRFDDRAEEVHREGLAVRRRVLGDRHRETAVSENNLASVLRLRGDFDQAERLLRHSLEVNIATRGARHPNVATSRHDLALIAFARGDYAAAESEIRAALQLQREGVGARHPTVALTLNSLAHVQVARGRHHDALASLREAIDIVRTAFGETHQLVAIFTLNAAAVHLALGEPAAAMPLLVEGLRLRTLAPGIIPSRRRTLPQDDWSIDRARAALASAATPAASAR